MAGNVWEWTADFFSLQEAGEPERPCCVPRNPRVTAPDGSFALGEPGEHIPRRVIKGGSHLCAPNYCLRYRPAARQAEAVDTSTGHIGFRCVVRPEES
jgi:formylglycine-generating enzyme required for sulfatase activity